MGVVPSHVERRAAGLLRHLSSILLLPFMNTVVIPALIVAGSARAGSPAVGFAKAGAFVGLAFGLPLLAGGALLVAASIRSFAVRGHGTLAPWDPPRALVITGPYRRLRNPMKAGLIVVLLAEALLFRSWPLAAWFAFFTTVNAVYIRISEEPGLARRFGQSYADYCAAVPRWLPWPRVGHATTPATTGSETITDTVSNPGTLARGDGRVRAIQGD